MNFLKMIQIQICLCWLLLSLTFPLQAQLRDVDGDPEALAKQVIQGGDFSKYDDGIFHLFYPNPVTPTQGQYNKVLFEKIVEQIESIYKIDLPREEESEVISILLGREEGTQIPVFTSTPSLVVDEGEVSSSETGEDWSDGGTSFCPDSFEGDTAESSDCNSFSQSEGVMAGVSSAPQVDRIDNGGGNRFFRGLKHYGYAERSVKANFSEFIRRKVQREVTRMVTLTNLGELTSEHIRFQVANGHFRPIPPIPLSVCSQLGCQSDRDLVDPPLSSPEGGDTGTR